MSVLIAHHKNYSYDNFNYNNAGNREWSQWDGSALLYLD
ncbi:hypothetical protein N644_1702 [Lactiplantibacillus paraplantarum]|nr:hypothetical protein N644_1702 [Lactiplantibacillus paraplantarum]